MLDVSDCGQGAFRKETHAHRGRSRVSRTARISAPLNPFGRSVLFFTSTDATRAFRSLRLNTQLFFGKEGTE